MKHVYDVVQNSNGMALGGISVTVRVANAIPGTGALASLFSNNGGTPTTNPVVSDSVGTYSFYVANGRYDLTFSGPGITTKTVPDLEFDDSTAAGVFTITTANANFAAAISNIYLVTTGASTITATLPTAVGIPGQSIIIKKVDSGAGSVTVAGTIDGATNYSVVNQWQFVEVTSDNANWQISSNN